MSLAQMAERALTLSFRAPRNQSRYCVGAVIFDADFCIVAEGYTAQMSEIDHAEECALANVPQGRDLSRCAILSTMIPCSHRSSRPKGCAQRIAEAGMTQVYYLIDEPTLFQVCRSQSFLASLGVSLQRLPGYEERALAALKHLPI